MVQKSFRKIPASIEAKLARIKEKDVKFGVGLVLTDETIANGTYEDIGLTLKRLQKETTWEVLPPQGYGKYALRNVDGWEVVRKDLPKYTKNFYHDIAIYGDAARNGTTTVAIPREVYHREAYPPLLFHFEVNVTLGEQGNKKSVSVNIDETFDRESPSFSEDALFALCLLQERFGCVDVMPAVNPDFHLTDAIDWEIFPPGSIEEVMRSIFVQGRQVSISEEAARERLEMLQEFQPQCFLRGLGGNNNYIGAKFSDDLVVFENLRAGNALYVLYEDWEAASKLSRSELLKRSALEYDRIVHKEGWQDHFATLMQDQLAKRGIRVRIGRNRRRRRILPSTN